MNIIKKYNHLSNKQCLESIRFLFENDVSFYILCDLSQVSFEPILPEETRKKLSHLTVFVLAGYTFESLRIFKDGIEFEAGFGPDNIGSVVSVGVEGIIQVILKNKEDNNELIFNRCNAHLIFESPDEDSIQNSIEAILSNPQNRKIVKSLQKNGKN